MCVDCVDDGGVENLSEWSFSGWVSVFDEEEEEEEEEEESDESEEDEASEPTPQPQPKASTKSPKIIVKKQLFQTQRLFKKIWGVGNVNAKVDSKPAVVAKSASTYDGFEVKASGKGKRTPKPNMTPDHRLLWLR